MGGIGDNKEKDKEKDFSTCLYVSPIQICVVPRAVSLICGVSCATYVLFPVTVPVTVCLGLVTAGFVSRCSPSTTQ